MDLVTNKVSKPLNKNPDKILLREGLKKNLEDSVDTFHFGLPPYCDPSEVKICLRFFACSYNIF